MTSVKVRCLTWGAIVCGVPMRAGQFAELDLDDGLLARCKVVAAAGDIELEILEPAITRVPLAKLKASEE